MSDENESGKDSDGVSSGRDEEDDLGDDSDRDGDSSVYI
jgi:hypothetical protein